MFDGVGTPPPNGCHCAVCWPRCPRFRACPTCGNKRCPKTQDHRFKCTCSNDSGQVGEIEEGEHKFNGPMRMGPSPKPVALFPSGDPIPDMVEPSPPQSREHMINGMRGVIRRMCRLGGVSAVTGSEVYCLVDYDDRELASALLAYVEGRPTWVER